MMARSLRGRALIVDGEYADHGIGGRPHCNSTNDGLQLAEEEGSQYRPWKKFTERASSGPRARSSR